MDLVVKEGTLQSQMQMSVKLFDIFYILTLIWVRNL